MANRIITTVYDLKDLVKAKLVSIGAAFKQNADTAEATGKRVDSSFKSSAKTLRDFSTRLSRIRFGLIGVAAVVGGTIRGLLALTKAAEAQELAEAKLETTLRNVVGARDDEIQRLKDQAAALQQTTRYGDEATISAQAMLGTFALNADEIEQLTPRILDMAEASSKLTGETVSLDDVSKAVGKAFTTGIGALSRYGVALTDAQKATFATADDSEKLKIVTEALDANFKGLAEAAGETFGGQMDRAGNAAGDFAESIGDLLTKNEGLQRLINGITEGFASLTESIKSDGGQSSAIISGIADAFRIIGNTSRIVFNGLTAGFHGLALIANSTIKTLIDGWITFNDFVGVKVPESLRNLQATFDGLVADNIKQITEDSDDMAEAFKDLGQAGRDLTNDVVGLAEATEELTEAQKREREEAAERLRLAREQQEKLEATQKAVKTLGLDYDLLTTKVSSAEKEQIAAFTSLAKAGQLTGKQLKVAFEEAVSGLKSKEAFAAFEASLQGLYESGEITEEQFGNLRVALANAKFGAQDLSKVLQDIIDKRKEQRQVSKQADEEIVEGTKEVVKETRGWLSEIINVINSWRQLGGTVAAAFDGVFERVHQSGQSFANFHRRFARELQGLNEDFQRSAKAADLVIDAYDNGTQSLQALGAAASAAASAVNQLDQARLDKLNKIIREAQDEMREFTEATKEALDTANEQLLQLTGTQEEIERQRTAARIEALKEQLQQAKLSYNKEAEANIQATLAAELEIARIKEEKRLEEEEKRDDLRERQKAKDIQAASEVPVPDFAAGDRTIAPRNYTIEITNSYFFGTERSTLREIARVLKDELDQLERFNA